MDRLRPKERRRSRTAQSMGRKSDFYERQIAEYKRQRTVEAELMQRRRSRAGSFKPLGPEDGVQVRQSVAASPAAHGVVVDKEEMMSKEEYSRHMRTMEERAAVVRDDEAAAES